MASVEIMSPSMIDRMRLSCRMAGECLVMVGKNIRIGMSTEEIDKLVHEWILANDAYPSPLNYRPSGAPRPFPKSVCTSVNEVVCHGIPGKRRLESGDIVNVDVTTYFKGYHGDTSATFYVGEPSENARRVVETARHSLERGIAAVKHGGRIWDIGAAIQEYAEGRGCSVVRDYVGHGVGREFHMKPQVPHYVPKPGDGHKNERMRAGMVFTIEPMINIGHWGTEVTSDDWTVVTTDGSLSAQFEHTVLVTHDGCEVLTDRPASLMHSEDKAWNVLGPLGTRVAYGERAGSALSA